MHISYSNGYYDALRDVYSWFDNHRHIIFKKQTLLAILRHFRDYLDEFFVEKECYEIEIYYPNDKKKPITIKRLEE